MQKKQILLIVLLLAVLVIGMFVFAYMSRQKMEPAELEQPTVDTNAQGVPDITSISAKHYFTDPPGVHTLAGELLMPTPCDLVTTNAVLLDNGTRAVVTFDVINNAAGTCEQKATTQRFKVGFQAPKDIKIEAVYKGNPIELKLTPASAGEKPADFQLFDKG